MANNNNNTNSHGQNPFWEFVQSFDPNGRTGAGVDHAAPGPSFAGGFPFGGPGSFNPWAGAHGWGGPWGGPPGDFAWGRRGGRHGRHGHRHHRRGGPESDREGEESEERDFDMGEDSPDTMRDDGPPGPPGPHGPPPPHPPPGGPHPPPPPHAFGEGPRHHGRHHSRHGHGAHGMRGGCRGRGGPRGRHGPPGPPPPFPSYNGPFDLRPLMQVLAGHPAAQAFREYFENRAAPQDESAEHTTDQDDTFVPPVDVFSTEKAYVLHVSLPGAVKEDVGVNWDADRSQLNIAGVVYRPGNEEFLQSLTSSERKVGMFERSIKLPPVDTDEKEEVDGLGITAKMENGVLIVTVPKAEKEWTEIHKIDIQ